MKKKVKGKVGIFHLDRRPMYYGCSGTIMAALQHANTALSDPLAYYAADELVFFFRQRQTYSPRHTSG